jgi:GTP pyrophosphokinase
MQRKGINIDEVLDLQAIRIIVDNKLDCYKVLGLIHIEYKPLIARFKDYVAIPKENGYQTIHTTVFYNSKIYEVQIRTQFMHNIAQYGVAAHWKYKNTEDNQNINLKWLNALETDSKNNIEEFYSDAKQDLFSEEILVYSPKGDLWTLPRGATAYDFAYMIHTDVGNYATYATINTIKKPLLTRLISGDIVSIKTGDELILRCSWIDMVATSKSKKAIKHNCQQRLAKIDELVGKNILNTISPQFSNDVIKNIKPKQLRNIPSKLNHLKSITKYLERKTAKTSIIKWLKIKALKFKTYIFDNVVIDSNSTINNVSFDHCCHPRFGDDIVAFKDKKIAFIHHKLCNNAYEKMKLNENMVFCRWIAHKFYVYKMVVNLPNTRGELAKLLVYLAKLKATILFVEYGKDKYAQNQFCKIDFEVDNANQKELYEKIAKKTKIIEFYSAQDAYKEKR